MNRAGVMNQSGGMMASGLLGNAPPGFQGNMMQSDMQMAGMMGLNPGNQGNQNVGLLGNVPMQQGMGSVSGQGMTSAMNMGGAMRSGNMNAMMPSQPDMKMIGTDMIAANRSNNVNQFGNMGAGQVSANPRMLAMEGMQNNMVANQNNMVANQGMIQGMGGGAMQMNQHMGGGAMQMSQQTGGGAGMQMNPAMQRNNHHQQQLGEGLVGNVLMPSSGQTGYQNQEISASRSLLPTPGNPGFPQGSYSNPKADERRVETHWDRKDHGGRGLGRDYDRQLPSPVTNDAEPYNPEEPTDDEFALKAADDLYRLNAVSPLTGHKRAMPPSQYDDHPQVQKYKSPYDRGNSPLSGDEFSDQSRVLSPKYVGKRLGAALNPPVYDTRKLSPSLSPKRRESDSSLEYDRKGRGESDSSSDYDRKRRRKDWQKQTGKRNSKTGSRRSHDTVGHLQNRCRSGSYSKHNDNRDRISPPDDRNIDNNKTRRMKPSERSVSKSERQLSCTTKEEDESIIVTLTDIYDDLKPEVIRASVNHPDNRVAPYDRSLLLERCLIDLRTRSTWRKEMNTKRKPSAAAGASRKEGHSDVTETRLTSRVHKSAERSSSREREVPCRRRREVVSKVTKKTKESTSSYRPTKRREERAKVEYQRVKETRQQREGRSIDYRYTRENRRTVVNGGRSRSPHSPTSRSDKRSRGQKETVETERRIITISSALESQRSRSERKDNNSRELVESETFVIRGTDSPKMPPRSDRGQISVSERPVVSRVEDAWYSNPMSRTQEVLDSKGFVLRREEKHPVLEDERYSAGMVADASSHVVSTQSSRQGEMVEMSIQKREADYVHALMIDEGRRLVEVNRRVHGAVESSHLGTKQAAEEERPERMEVIEITYKQEKPRDVDYRYGTRGEGFVNTGAGVSYPPGPPEAAPAAAYGQEVVEVTYRKEKAHYGDNGRYTRENESVLTPATTTSERPFEQDLASTFERREDYQFRDYRCLGKRHEYENAGSSTTSQMPYVQGSDHRGQYQHGDYPVKSVEHAGINVDLSAIPMVPYQKEMVMGAEKRGEYQYADNRHPSESERHAAVTTDSSTLVTTVHRSHDQEMARASEINRDQQHQHGEYRHSPSERHPHGQTSSSTISKDSNDRGGGEYYKRDYEKPSASYRGSKRWGGYSQYFTRYDEKRESAQQVKGKYTQQEKPPFVKGSSTTTTKGKATMAVVKPYIPAGGEAGRAEATWAGPGFPGKKKKKKRPKCFMKSCQKLQAHMRRHVANAHLPVSYFEVQGGETGLAPETRMQIIEDTLTEICAILGCRNFEELLKKVVKLKYYPPEYMMNTVTSTDLQLITDFHMWMESSSLQVKPTICPPNTVAALVHWRALAFLITSVGEDKVDLHKIHLKNGAPSRDEFDFERRYKTPTDDPETLKAENPTDS